MIEVSVAPLAQESPEIVECFRHEGEDCPRCDGSGYRPRRRCEGCGEPSGSISQGTGFPLVKDRRTGGRWYHVNCRPQAGGVDALLADLERMGRLMAAQSPASAYEIHHAVPQCLLRLRDRADAHEEFDGEGIQLWLDYELEALRFGVDPDVSREELAALIEGSTVLLPREEHRNGHENDFVRWGRKGGITTLRRYGTSWFLLLARRRWERLSRAELERVFAIINGGRS